MPRAIQNPASRTLAPVAAVLALALIGISGSVSAGAGRTDGHRIFIAAGAPWGEPGARSEFRFTCADTVTRDTLYLSFEPAADDSAFLTAGGEVYFYAQPGDTLGSFWEMEKGGRNNGGLVIQFGPDATFPQPQPWAVQGLAVVKYERTAQSGLFRFVFAVPATHPGPVRAGTRYVIGRIVLGAKHSGLDGGGKPVCVEWHAASLGFKGRPMEFASLGESRWLESGGPAGCRQRIPAWRPTSGTAPKGRPR